MAARQMKLANIFRLKNQGPFLMLLPTNRPYLVPLLRTNAYQNSRNFSSSNSSQFRGNFGMNLRQQRINSMDSFDNRISGSQQGIKRMLPCSTGPTSQRSNHKPIFATVHLFHPRPPSGGRMKPSNNKGIRKKISKLRGAPSNMRPQRKQNGSAAPRKTGPRRGKPNRKLAGKKLSSKKKRTGTGKGRLAKSKTKDNKTRRIGVVATQYPSVDNPPVKGRRGRDTKKPSVDLQPSTKRPPLKSGKSKSASSIVPRRSSVKSHRDDRNPKLMPPKRSSKSAPKKIPSDDRNPKLRPSKRLSKSAPKIPSTSAVGANKKKPTAQRKSKSMSDVVNPITANDRKKRRRPIQLHPQSHRQRRGSRPRTQEPGVIVRLRQPPVPRCYCRARREKMPNQLRRQSNPENRIRSADRMSSRNSQRDMRERRSSGRSSMRSQSREMRESRSRERRGSRSRERRGSRSREMRESRSRSLDRPSKMSLTKATQTGSSSYERNLNRSVSQDSHNKLTQTGRSLSPSKLPTNPNSSRPSIRSNDSQRIREDESRNSGNRRSSQLSVINSLRKESSLKRSTDSMAKSRDASKSKSDNICGPKYKSIKCEKCRKYLINNKTGGTMYDSKIHKSCI